MTKKAERPKFPSAEAEINHYRRLAYHDHKTGLGNEHKLEDWKTYEYKPQSRTYLFAFIDIKKFKKFNDDYGQKAGDLLIAEFGGSLNELYRDSRSEINELGFKRADPGARDVIIRIGGDEVLICYDLDHFKEKKLADAIEVIFKRLAKYRLTDPKTGESFAVRAVYELTTPENPIEYEEIETRLSQKIIDLKKRGG